MLGKFVGGIFDARRAKCVAPGTGGTVIAATDPKLCANVPLPNESEHHR
jgi:hypothetical protein